MSGKVLLLEQLQEISLWQQLNKQLLNLRKKGFPITDIQHKRLKDFCLKNSLFRKISDSLVGNDIPLSLITDFKKYYFITLNLRAWTNIITDLKSNLYVLDIERARANSFKELKKLSGTVQLLNAEDKQYDNDSELYNVINEYTNELERVKHDLPDMILKLHALKATIVKKIIQDNTEIKKDVNEHNRIIMLDISTLRKKNEEAYLKIIHNYSNNFINKIDPILHPLGVVTLLTRYSGIQGFLKKKLADKDIKGSVREFVSHELEKYEKEVALIDRFHQVFQEIKEKNIIQLIICDTSSFAFLDNPYPGI